MPSPASGAWWFRSRRSAVRRGPRPCGGQRGGPRERVRRTEQGRLGASSFSYSLKTGPRCGCQRLFRAGRCGRRFVIAPVLRVLSSRRGLHPPRPGPALHVPVEPSSLVFQFPPSHPPLSLLRPQSLTLTREACRLDSQTQSGSCYKL